MLIKTTPDIKPSEITSEADYLNRRQFLQHSINTGLSGLMMTTAPGLLLPQATDAATLQYKKNGRYSTDEEWTDFSKATTYNNFYEFGTGKKDPSRNSGDFKPMPWTVTVSGECHKPGEMDIGDLLQPHSQEERIYRLRCVEAWSMVIPWVGIPLGNVLQRFEPTSKAKYVAFTTVFRPAEMPGQKRNVLDWPYVEGLRIDEAMHPLSLLATGMYGKDLPNQNGPPIRLILPWKYGFKSIKSIDKITFTEQQPPTSWNIYAPAEYGFYSNVNPDADHPRWSQRKERRIGEFFKRDTMMFNGYAEEVASLYSGMDLKKYY